MHEAQSRGDAYVSAPTELKIATSLDKKSLIAQLNREYSGIAKHCSRPPGLATDLRNTEVLFLVLASHTLCTREA